MEVERLFNKQRLKLDPTSTLGVGGEARIYTVPSDRSLVAKVYHTPSEAQTHKLVMMVVNPPDDPMRAHGHISIAWPVDVLCTANRQHRVVGFLMPRVTERRPLMACYNPLTRRQQWPLFNYRYLLRTAHNLAAAVRALHARGYVIGDVNESNVLVADTALVTLVDTDSFQVRDPRRDRVYRCPVGKPEFTPPELHGHPLAQIDRLPEHDRFGVAVLIFQLLMEGTHPFAGVYHGSGDPPPYETRIASGHFPYAHGQYGPYHPMPAAPSFRILPPALQEMFVRCFKTGHRHPQARPTAQDWQMALYAAEHTLTSCAVNDQHVYSQHLRPCPWCERTTQLGGRDPFPSRQSAQLSSDPAMPSQLTPRPVHQTSTTATGRRFVQPRSQAAAPTPARPSRLRSAITGAWGGLISALCLSMVVYTVQHGSALEMLPALIVEAGQESGWGALWGVVWGMLWGLCRRPTTSGHGARRPGRLLSGVVLGAFLGMLTSLLIGVTPGYTPLAPQETFLGALAGTAWGPPLSMLQTALRGFLNSLYGHAIPGASTGAGLGFLWGSLRR